MANPDDRHRPVDEDEAVPLLAADNRERSSSPSTSIRRPPLLQRLSTFHEIARVTALQFVSINVLWPFVPLGLVGGVLQWNPILVFVFNFVAIIPLSAAVSDSSDNLADEFGELWGALINATFGNAVELIVNTTSSLRAILRLIV
jgi:Ca2+:H+ antiporter